MPIVLITEKMLPIAEPINRERDIVGQGHCKVPGLHTEIHIHCIGVDGNVRRGGSGSGPGPVSGLWERNCLFPRSLQCPEVVLCKAGEHGKKPRCGRPITQELSNRMQNAIEVKLSVAVLETPFRVADHLFREREKGV